MGHPVGWTHFGDERDKANETVQIIPAVFTGRSAEAGLELTLSLSHSVSKRQMSLLMASNAKSAQSKDG